jgi:hypothetical protein
MLEIVLSLVAAGSTQIHARSPRGVGTSNLSDQRFLVSAKQPHSSHNNYDVISLV